MQGQLNNKIGEDMLKSNPDRFKKLKSLKWEFFQKNVKYRRTTRKTRSPHDMLN